MRPLPPEVEAELAGLPPQEADELRRIWSLAGLPAPNVDHLSGDLWARIEAELDEAKVDEAELDAPAPVIPIAQARSRSAVRSTTASRSPRRAWFSMAAALALVAGVAVTWWATGTTTFEAGVGEQLTVSLPDGSTVNLNAGSTLSHERGFGDTHRNLKLDGEAFFSVESEAVPFIVETFNAEVRVVGTEFNVRARAEDGMPATHVAVKEGIVEVSQTAGFVGRLEAGEAVGVTHDITSIPEVDAGAWRSGAFQFAGFPLSALTAEIERRYDVQINVDPAIASTPVTMRLEAPETADDVLRTLAEYYGYALDSGSGSYTLKPR
ncbi:MAG: FecR domain-containing protein [Bacteroidota bacterium]